MARITSDLKMDIIRHVNHEKFQASIHGDGEAKVGEVIISS